MKTVFGHLKYDLRAIDEPKRSRQAQISLVKYKFIFYLASSSASSPSLLKKAPYYRVSWAQPGLNEQAQKFGLGSFDLKFYRLTKISGKAENYAISTKQQLELELPFLLGSDEESELNGKKSVI